MLQVQLPVGVGLILALGAGSGVWTAKLDSRDDSKITGTARVESVPAPAMTPDNVGLPGNHSRGCGHHHDGYRWFNYCLQWECLGESRGNVD